MVAWRPAPLLLVAVLAIGCPETSQRFDFDGDGAEDARDCDSADPSIHPGALDEVGDGVDRNCDGLDGVDADGDGFAANAPLEGGEQDCNDADPAVNPAAEEIPDDEIDNDCAGGDFRCDDDEDGVDADHELCPGGTDCDDANSTCFFPEHCSDADGDGQSICHGDCDDGNAARFVGNPEVCDGLDNDCNAEVPADEADVDLDGWIACEDCDDLDDARHPGADEICDGLDSDCAGGPGADEADLDGDGDPGCSDCDDDDEEVTSADADGDGYSSCGYDCDDEDPDVFPFAFDLLGDGIDSNCDGIDGIDADGDLSPQGDDCDDSDPALNPDDLDGDGYSTCGGDCDDADPDLTPVDGDFDGFSTCFGDCDDAAYDVNPSVPEVCDLVDNDCDGVQVDEVGDDGDGDPACNDCDDGDPAIEALDADGDGYTLCGNGVDDSETDCDDTSIAYHPFAIDTVGDGLDHNCDGHDGMDFDGDGFASVLSGGEDCVDSDAGITPEDDDSDGASFCGGDCDDGDPALNVIDLDADGASTCDGDCDDALDTIAPGLLEACDGLDNDCDAATLETADDDGDGQTECDGDCDDTDPVTFAGAPEQCDGVDNDCDGAVDDGIGVDGDDDGQLACAGDCNDLDDHVFAGAPELCDGLDNDCDGSVPAAEADDDADGFRVCEADCDDADTSRSPGATEVCDGADADCDGVADDDCVVCDLTVPTDEPTLQGGLDASGAGDVVCVEPGTYVGPFSLPGDVHLAGVAGPGATVLDGGDAGQVLTMTGGTVEGFTVTGGAGSGGGALSLTGYSPTLRRLWFAGNTASYGGAIQTSNSGVSIVDCRFTDNEATGLHGGALYLQGGAPVIERSTFSGNVAAEAGGAIWMGSSTTLVAGDVVFVDNEAGAGGGAIRVAGGLTLDRAIVVSNSASRGGGFYMEGTFTVTNFVVAENLAWGYVQGGGGADVGSGAGTFSQGHFIGNALGSLAGGGAALRLSSNSASVWMDGVSVTGNASVTSGTGGIQLMGYADLYPESNNVWGNTPDDWAGFADPAGSDGNLSEDPLLLDTSHPDPLFWDLHLDVASPLVDAGASIDTDLDLSPVDIGSFGGPDAGTWDRDGDGSPSWWQPGPYDFATYPTFGWDCDDLDPTVYAGEGC